MLLCHSSRKSRKSEAVRIVIIGKTNGYCWDISRYREQSRLKDALINCTSLPQTQSVDAPINQIPCVDALINQMPSFLDALIN